MMWLVRGLLLSAVLAACWLAALALPSSQARPKAPTTAIAMSASGVPRAAPAGRLRFGVYPWGRTGCARRCASSVAEDADRSMAAVKQLKGRRSFVVHLYGDYTGVSSRSADSLISEASWWASHGLHVAAILRYRPASRRRAAGYRAWVRTQARRLAALPKTVSIQIANEPTNRASNAGDGSYPGVVGAIARAVPAARREVVAAGRPDILIGFNWAAGRHPARTEPIWGKLKRAGGSAFTRAVGFVAVNVYPGTWSAPLSTSSPSARQVRATMRTTLHAMRNKHMVAAGVSRAAITVGETGYPTTAKRSQATQDRVLRAIAAAVNASRARYGITDLYWFALRDGNSASRHLENGYGLLRDDYRPKRAFTTLRTLVARLGA